MKVEKKTAEYTVFKRADGRFAVQGKDKKFINGEDKVKVLVAEGLRAAPKPKPKAAPAEEVDDSADSETAAE